MATTSIAINTQLLDITEVQPYSIENPTDVQCFNEIRQVLEKYNYEDRFGICLLHKHFDVFSDERLVESCDFSNRILTIEPVNVESIASTDNLIETSWNLSAKKPIPAVSCDTYCWSDSSGKHNRSHTKE
jgi:hypothetical protein